MIVRSMRLCIWTQALTLMAIGAWGLLHIFRSREADEWVPIVAYCTAVFLPVVLCVAFLRQIRLNAGQRPKLSLPLALSTLPYLPVMITLATIKPPFTMVVAPLILAPAIWLLCSYLYALLNGEVVTPNSEQPDRLGKYFRRTKRLVSSPVVLLVGAILPITGFVLDRDDATRILLGQTTWITAEYGLGHGLHAARVMIDYAGRVCYAAALLCSALMIVLLLLHRFSTVSLQKSRNLRLLKYVLVFLAILSVADYFYSWIWFLSGDGSHVAYFILLALFLAQWAVPILLLMQWRNSRIANESTIAAQRLALIFYLPVWLFVVAMTPFFLDDVQFLNCATAYVGLVFLAFGVLGISSASRESAS